MNIRNKLSMEPIPAAPIQSYKEVEVFFQSILGLWENSETRRQLRATLSSVTTPHKIKKIVGFAFGPIAHSHVEEPYALRSAFQHALVLTLRHILGTEHQLVQGATEGPTRRTIKATAEVDQSGRPTDAQNCHSQITCYVQDPAYSDIDKSLLEGYKITALDDPKAFLAVDDATVVVSCAADVSVRQIISDLARPAILIWDRVCNEESKVIRQVFD